MEVIPWAQQEAKLGAPFPQLLPFVTVLTRNVSVGALIVNPLR